MCVSGLRGVLAFLEVDRLLLNSEELATPILPQQHPFSPSRAGPQAAPLLPTPIAQGALFPPCQSRQHPRRHGKQKRRRNVGTRRVPGARHVHFRPFRGIFCRQWSARALYEAEGGVSVPEPSGVSVLGALGLCGGRAAACRTV